MTIKEVKRLFHGGWNFKQANPLLYVATEPDDELKVHIFIFSDSVIFRCKNDTQREVLWANAGGLRIDLGKQLRYLVVFNDQRKSRSREVMTPFVAGLDVSCFGPSSDNCDVGLFSDKEASMLFLSGKKIVNDNLNKRFRVGDLVFSPTRPELLKFRIRRFKQEGDKLIAYGDQNQAEVIDLMKVEQDLAHLN